MFERFTQWIKRRDQQMTEKRKWKEQTQQQTRKRTIQEEKKQNFDLYTEPSTSSNSPSPNSVSSHSSSRFVVVSHHVPVSTTTSASSSYQEQLALPSSIASDSLAQSISLNNLQESNAEPPDDYEQRFHQLLCMGFNNKQAEESLKSTNYEVEQAIAVS